MRISASLLSADFTALGASIREAEDAGCDELHFDVMDGHFVPNITFGIPVLAAIRPLTRLPIDVHMMVTEPGRYARAFAEAGGDIFTVHVEACADVEGTIGRAREAGMRPAVSIKPATPVSAIERLLGGVDRVLVMTVEPGFGGQLFMADMLPKIGQLRRMGAQRRIDLEIAVDGGIKADTIGRAVAAGAQTVISGSGVFGRPEGVAAAVQNLRRAATT